MSFETLLLDIEGTVCPISFVKEVLFPYFGRKVPFLLRSNDQGIIDLLTQFPEDKKECWIDYVLDLVKRDVKDPVLKQLQGYVWAQGYESGEIKAPVYPDAIDLIKRTKDVYIYSSGSVKAQKLLFGHVENPDGGESLDLQPFIKGYFDINTSGRKIEAQSYLNILKEIGKDADKVLFISDNEFELDAARAAGMSTLLAVRPGNGPLMGTHEYKVVKDYSEL